MKNSLKMGLVAITVIGSMSSVYASSHDATIKFHASLSSTTCDLTFNNSGQVIELGHFAKSDFLAAGKVLPGNNTATLNVGSCSGADIPAGKTISLVAHEVNVGAGDLHRYKLFGDNTEMGVGIQLSGQSYSATAAATPNDLGNIAPDEPIDISEPGAAEVKASGLKLPDFIKIMPSLYAISDPKDMKAGDINTTVIFSAEYN
ncbi:fimbrial protein [Klebsiella aerogenes]|nr:type 1 fimbrial protein [Klebsiella aerogenes]